MPHPRRLIWFCQTEHVAKQPEQLALLRDEIGLTTIMPESPICHTSGFRASPEVAARGGAAARGTLGTHKREACGARLGYPTPPPPLPPRASPRARVAR